MLNELPGSTNELQVGRVAAQFSKVARGSKFGFEQRREEEKRERKKKRKKKEKKRGKKKMSRTHHHSNLQFEA